MEVVRAMWTGGVEGFVEEPASSWRRAAANDDASTASKPDTFSANFFQFLFVNH